MAPHHVKYKFGREILLVSALLYFLISGRSQWKPDAVAMAKAAPALTIKLGDSVIPVSPPLALR
jgi:hypothetical protein